MAAELSAWEGLKDLLSQYSDALTTLSIVASAILTVWVFLRRRLARAWKWSRTPSLRARLGSEIARIRAQRTLTRSTVTIGTLIEDPELWVEPRFVDPALAATAPGPGVGRQLRVEDLCSLLLHSSQQTRLALVGAAARGKSTFARKLFCELAEAYQKRQCRRYPVFVDLSEPLAREESSGDSSARSSPDRPALRGLIARTQRDGIILVADGLDEAFYSGRRSEAYEVLKLPGTKGACVALVRPTTFVEFLKYSPEVAPTRTLHFADYDANRLLAFARATLDRVWGASAERRAQLLPLVGDAVERGVVAAPLHVVMAVENALSLPPDRALHFDSLARVYGRYVESLLQRETAALPGSLKSFQVQEVLEYICGALVLRVAPGNTFQSPGVSFGLAHIREACEAVLGTSHATAADLGAPTWIAVRSLLERESETGAEPGRWKFSHPSFVDFFVARHVLRQLESDAGRTARLMAVHMPQEVYTFLKMFIKLDVDAQRAAQIVGVARTVLDDQLNRAQSGEAIAELQIEQVAHLVAHIRHPEAIDFARQVARKLPTPFVSRGVAIGLAFGGVEDDLRRYVSDLEAEYLAQGLGPKNALNLEHQLAYFGDVVSQFQIRPSGTRIVTASQLLHKQLSQLRGPLHSASRVVDLYTVEVLLRIAHTNEPLRAEIRLLLTGIEGLLLAPHLSADASLGHRLGRLSDALEGLRAQLRTET